MGFPFFKPLYEEQAEFMMYRCPFHSKFVETILSRIMTPPGFPVRYSEISAKLKYVEASTSAFEIGSVTITPIPISHPDKGSGYKFTEDGKSFVFLTDNELGFIHPGGLPYKDYMEFSVGADLLIHDAEYLPEEYPSKIEWGHSVFTETLNLAIEAGVKQFGLFHLNQERTDQQVDEMVESCRRTIAARGHNLECFAVGCDMTFTL
jgi:ribonuclease BN (tRNA processing enzyme)